jgi:hypothetical protein
MKENKDYMKGMSVKDYAAWAGSMAGAHTPKVIAGVYRGYNDTSRDNQLVVVYRPAGGRQKTYRAKTSKDYTYFVAALKKLGYETI